MYPVTQTISGTAGPGEVEVRRQLSGQRSGRSKKQQKTVLQINSI